MTEGEGRVRVDPSVGHWVDLCFFSLFCYAAVFLAWIVQKREGLMMGAAAEGETSGW